MFDGVSPTTADTYNNNICIVRETIRHFKDIQCSLI